MLRFGVMWTMTSCLSLCLWACGGNSDSGNGDGGLFQLRGACSMATRLGGFSIVDQEDFSVVEGQVSDGVVPITILNEVAKEGDCRLLKKPDLSCDPPCQAGQTCNLQNTCIAYPAQQDVGSVTVSGLEKTVEMWPRQPGNKYFDTELPNPLFDPGAKIYLRSTAGHFGELALYGYGVAPLAMQTEQWNVEPSQPLAIAWDPPPADAHSRIEMQLTINQHGLSPVALRCDLTDSGSVSVSDTLIDALLQAGISGYPNGKLVRRTADSIGVEGGCVELIVSTFQVPEVRVSGHTPCDDPTDCPEEQTCDLETQTCH